MSASISEDLRTRPGGHELEREVRPSTLSGRHVPAEWSRSGRSLGMRAATLPFTAVRASTREPRLVSAERRGRSRPGRPTDEAAMALPASAQNDAQGAHRGDGRPASGGVHRAQPEATIRLGLSRLFGSIVEGFAHDRAPSVQRLRLVLAGLICREARTCTTARRSSPSCRSDAYSMRDDEAPTPTRRTSRRRFTATTCSRRTGRSSRRSSARAARRPRSAARHSDGSAGARRSSSAGSRTSTRPSCARTTGSASASTRSSSTRPGTSCSGSGSSTRCTRYRGASPATVPMSSAPHSS